jgi:hypothetical protein
MPNDKPQAKSPTFIFVGGVIGAALLWVAWTLFSLPWFIAIAVLLAWEAWTFFNSYLNDTISEILWVLAKRPLVPFIFGAATDALISHGVIPVTMEGLYIAVVVGFLMGHFFFQAHRD